MRTNQTTTAAAPTTPATSDASTTSTDRITLLDARAMTPLRPGRREYYSADHRSMILTDAPAHFIARIVPDGSNTYLWIGTDTSSGQPSDYQGRCAYGVVSGRALYEAAKAIVAHYEMHSPNADGRMN